jgi:hypothetical protein
VVLAAQGESPAAQEALEKLCRTYWRPVYSFIRRQGAGREEADDPNWDPLRGDPRFERIVASLAPK